MSRWFPLALAALSTACGGIARDWFYQGAVGPVAFDEGQTSLDIEVQLHIPEEARAPIDRLTTDSFLVDLRGGPRVEPSFTLNGRDTPIERPRPGIFRFQGLHSWCPPQGDCTHRLQLVLERPSSAGAAQAQLYLEYFVQIEEQGVVNTPDDALVDFDVRVDGEVFDP